MDDIEVNAFNDHELDDDLNDDLKDEEENGLYIINIYQLF